MRASIPLLVVSMLIFACGGATSTRTAQSDSSTDILGAKGALEGNDEEGGELLRPFATPTGAIQTFTVSGEVDTNNPFFTSLGTNGRSCVSCHQASDGWTITPRHVQARFNATNGLDPIFRRNDGANSPNIDDSTVEARRRGYSMLLGKALIRIGIWDPGKLGIRTCCSRRSLSLR